MKCASVGREGWRTMGVVGRDNAMKCASVGGEGLEDNGGGWSGQCDEVCERRGRRVGGQRGVVGRDSGKGC